MKSAHFLTEFIFLTVIVAAIVGLPLALIPPDPTNYFQASLLKTQLLKDTPSPRLIVVGGSNVAFGIDSELLEAALDMPVINAGLHGGMGEISYREVRASLRPGDIVLLMPEYYMFGDEQAVEGNDSILAQWIEYDLSRMRFISFARIPTLALTMAQVKMTRAAAFAYEAGDLGRGIYLSKNFDSRGDFVGHLQIEPPDMTAPFDIYLKSNILSNVGFDFFEQFNLDALEKGATVYFEFPASRDANCRLTGIEKITRLYWSIQERTTIPVLTPLNQICLPDAYFFDTPYHLNAAGRQTMTERIIQDMLPVLPR
ncbi:MAG: hypothetical protein HFACDABA_02198 [Anaerolineales bacterium]|nr:hypothetical protein [Anaerolineales bacterium]